MQAHYGLIRSLNFKGIKTPYKFKNQFTIYSPEDNYLRKEELKEFLVKSYSSLGYSCVLITRTQKPYSLAGDFVIPSRGNYERFILFLRIIKSNNSFLKFEAFHTGNNFQVPFRVSHHYR